MRELIIGAANATVVMGVSPWILPLIAVVAKRKEEEARKAPFGRFLRIWRRPRGNAKRHGGSRDRIVMHERLRAKLEATIWPD